MKYSPCPAGRKKTETKHENKDSKKLKIVPFKAEKKQNTFAPSSSSSSSAGHSQDLWRNMKYYFLPKGGDVGFPNTVSHADLMPGCSHTLPPSSHDAALHPAHVYF